MLLVISTGLGAASAGAGLALASESTPPPPLIADPTGAEALIGRARAQNLAASREWRALLFYLPRWFGADTGIIDSPEFYLDPRGGEDPEAELEATLRGFHAPWDAARPDAHPLCRYPARRAFLAEALGPLGDKWRQVDCPALGKWLSYHDVDGVSLVFAAYFLNNPASMYGHTFLRLHRRVPPGRRESPAMLDFAVNFAANPTTNNVLAYPILGLAGGFPGTFSLMPYYLKVQEYNNSESRDLWEYRLAFGADETRKLLAVLWEVGPWFIDYYYLDENCSLVMLLALDAVRPEARLAGRFWLIAPPADTLRAVTRTPGMVADVSWRASNRGRLLSRAADLDAVEAKALAAVIRNGPAALDADVAALAVDGQARVLDAALEWIDFQTALGSEAPDGEKAALRNVLLRRRAAVVVPPRPVQSPPASARPDMGPTAQFVGLGLGRDGEGRGYAELDWRPALHRLQSAPAGYSPHLQMNMINALWRWTAREPVPRLRRFTLFDAVSVTPMTAVLRSPSWRYALMAEREGDMPDLWRFFTEGGIGAAVGDESRWCLYGLVLAEVGASERYSGRLYAGPGAAAGAFLDFGRTLRVSASGRIQREAARDGALRLRRSVRGALSGLHGDSVETSGWVERDLTAGTSFGIETSIAHF